MRRQLRRFRFDEIGFYMLDNSVAHSRRQQTDDGGVNFRRRGKRPAFISILRDDFYYLVGQFFLDTPIHFRCQMCSLGYRPRAMVSSSAVSHREPPGQIADLIHKSPVCVGNVECLHELQARSARGSLIHSICLQTTSISDDNERTRYHGESLTKNWPTRHKGAPDIPIIKFVRRCNIALA
jgi:hypothetical protein